MASAFAIFFETDRDARRAVTTRFYFLCQLPRRLPFDDDLHAVAGLRLRADLVVVHDREGRRVHDALALAHGDRLPRVTLLHGVELEPVRANVRRFLLTQLAEGLQ